MFRKKLCSRWKSTGEIAGKERMVISVAFPRSSPLHSSVEVDGVGSTYFFENPKSLHTGVLVVGSKPEVMMRIRMEKVLYLQVWVLVVGGEWGWCVLCFVFSFVVRQK